MAYKYFFCFVLFFVFVFVFVFVFFVFLDSSDILEESFAKIGGVVSS